MINYRSYNDMFNVIVANISILPTDIDLIVGIPRSGMAPAYIIGNILDCGVTDFYSFIRNEKVKGGRRFLDREKESLNYKKILILDDSVNSGTALSKIKNEINSILILENCPQILFAAVYATEKTKSLIHYFFEIVDCPRVFQWNLFSHDIIQNACFDLDGVLCHDVTEEVNDDGEKYLHFIENVGLLIKPGKKIDKIVTCRIEKYRDVTVKWLNKNDIHYNELIMLDFPDGISRRKWNRHAEYKAEVYLKCNNQLFIESSIEQATKISNLTGKAVYCFDTKQMINTEIVSKTSTLNYQIDKRSFFYKTARKIKTKYPRIFSAIIKLVVG